MKGYLFLAIFWIISLTIFQTTTSNIDLTKINLSDVSKIISDIITAIQNFFNSILNQVKGVQLPAQK